MTQSVPAHFSWISYWMYGWNATSKHLINNVGVIIVVIIGIGFVIARWNLILGVSLRCDSRESQRGLGYGHRESHQIMIYSLLNLIKVVLKVINIK